MNDYSFYRRIRGPVYLLTFGVTALLAMWDVLSFDQSWPLYLIVAGLLRLAEIALYRAPQAGYPGYAVPGAPGYAAPGYTTPGYPGYAAQGFQGPGSPATAAAEWTPTRAESTAKKSNPLSIAPMGASSIVENEPGNTAPSPNASYPRQPELSGHSQTQLPGERSSNESGPDFAPEKES